jgi:hypothetical protein
MKNYQSDWVLNLVLKLAVAVFLSTLALGLLVGVNPLTALLRSGTAFMAFAILGWATSLAWTVPELEEVPVQSEEALADQEQQPAANESPPGNEAPITGDQ